MKQTPLISVVRNCYNGEKYLKEAIDSIYAQTYSNWEIIFLDNASVDNSEAIAKSYNSKLLYFKTPKLLQLHEARNLAKKLTQWSKKLKNSKHRYIITSGGGPGIMEAANRGASEAKGLAIGLNITLPHEQSGNKWEKIIFNENVFNFFNNYFFYT